MLRFATSPTGDMHISDLRVAIFNYIVSKQRKEELIVRIEDMESEKNIQNKDTEILGILSLFGIEYSQVIYQSQNVRFHSAMALQLVHEKKAFSCFCSSEWLEKKRKEAQKAKEAYSYDDACRNLPAELVIDNTNPFTIRVVKPDKSIVVKDYIQRETSSDSSAIDSFVIMTQEKVPTYNFACAVDDMLNDISIIIQDQKHINNTLKQVHIRDLLEYNKKIQYAHLPDILNDKGEKISQHENNLLNVKWLLEEGFLPEAIANYLLSMGNTFSEEIFNIKDAISWFCLEKVSKNPVCFNIDTLRKINKKHLETMDAKELSRYVGFADAEIGELARVYLEEAQTTKELKGKIAPIFSQRNIPQGIQAQTSLMREVIKKAPYFDEYDTFKNYISKKSGLHGDDYDKSLRILLTNAEKGPDIALVYKYLKNYIGEIIK